MYNGPAANNVTSIAHGQTWFHDDKSTYSGVYAQGGPTTIDNNITLGNLMDRSDYDVRGRKVDHNPNLHAKQGGGGRGGNNVGSMLDQAQEWGQQQKLGATYAGSANKKGGVYDRLTDTSTYTGVYAQRQGGDGRINAHSGANTGRSYQGNTNQGTDMNIRDISSTLRR